MSFLGCNVCSNWLGSMFGMGVRNVEEHVEGESGVDSLDDLVNVVIVPSKMPRVRNAVPAGGHTQILISSVRIRNEFKRVSGEVCHDLVHGRVEKRDIPVLSGTANHHRKMLESSKILRDLVVLR